MTSVQCITLHKGYLRESFMTKLVKNIAKCSIFITCLRIRQSKEIEIRICSGDRRHSCAVTFWYGEWLVSAYATAPILWWRHQMETFPRYWPFVQGIHRSPVNSLHKGLWRGASLMLALICAWISRWVNNREACDLRRHRAHYDVIVMLRWKLWTRLCMCTWARFSATSHSKVNPEGHWWIDSCRFLVICITLDQPPAPWLHIIICTQ